MDMKKGNLEVFSCYIGDHCSPLDNFKRFDHFVYLYNNENKSIEFLNIYANPSIVEELGVIQYSKITKN